MNKPMFYVGLTRYVDKAFCFVFRQEVSNLADLKRCLSKQAAKPSTLDFTCQQEIVHSRRTMVHGEVIGIKDVVTFQGRSVDDLKEAFVNYSRLKAKACS